MSTLLDAMNITIHNINLGPQERLRERLDRAALLRCPQHEQSVVAVTIHGRENGWFDSQWITCCESLERQAAAIVRDRC